MKIKLQDHILVPKHEVMSEEEAKELLDALGINREDLPKIKAEDPIAKEIGAKKGDIVKITREDEFTGKSVVYRLVV